MRATFQRDPKAGLKLAQEVLGEFLPGLAEPFDWLAEQLHEARRRGNRKRRSVAISGAMAAAAVDALMQAGHTLDSACKAVSAKTEGRFSRDGKQLLHLRGNLMKELTKPTGRESPDAVECFRYWLDIHNEPKSGAP